MGQPAKKYFRVLLSYYEKERDKAPTLVRSTCTSNRLNVVYYFYVDLCKQLTVKPASKKTVEKSITQNSRYSGLLGSLGNFEFVKAGEIVK